MEAVPDLTETDIISVLHKVTLAHLNRAKSTSSPDTDEMQVEPAPVQTQGTSSLEEYLGRCVSYDTSASALRLALRKSLSDVAEVVAVLQVLESWMRKWGEAENELGVFVATSPVSEDGPTQQLPESSKVRTLPDCVKTHLKDLLGRLYRSFKQS